MSNVFEIRPRSTGELEIFINGMPTEYYNDPKQAFQSCLEQALLEGKPPGEQSNARALELCEERSRYCLGRIINNIQAGSLIPGGVPFGAGGLDLSPIRKPKRVSESEAVDAFLNRGKLKGLDVDARHKRVEEAVQQKDHIAEWKDRRRFLIDVRERELAELVADMAKSDSIDFKKDKERAFLVQELAALKSPVLAATHGFQYAYGQYLTKQVDMVNDDIRIVPCMVNTTADTERDGKSTVSAFTTLDEFDGAGYSTGGQALDNQAVNIDDANDRAEFDSDDEAATLSAGTRSIQGNLLIKFITNLNSSLPLHWLEYASNKTPDGSLFTVVFNAEGILQAADG